MSAMYSAQLLDHFQNPRNPGEILDADATAEVENPVCGDVLRISLKISAGKIARMQFKAKGCVASIACASALTEMVDGKSIDEARKLRQQDVGLAVGGLPPASNHAAQLALDALAIALRRIER
jgi:nitrogen fixation protein NifU and related proteins